MNESDSERIAAQLDKKGHQSVKNLKTANLVIINICSVRQSAINRVYSKVHSLNRCSPRPKLVLTGCILEHDRQKLKDRVDQIWPLADLDTSAKCQSKISAYLPVMTGCNNFCSYCAVPYTRGREISRPAQAIIKETKKLIKQNYKEIILLGQNVNSYQSKNTNFAKLLQMIEQLPGNFKIKFLTSHPKDLSDQLISVMTKSKKIAKEIHLPIQSGDNQVLKKMNRGYTVAQYKKLIKKIRQKMPEIKISTDIIVGFPSETKKQFQNTVKIVKEIKFNQAYIARYSPRPGTTAAKLKDNVPGQEKKRRWQIINKILNK